MNAMTPQEFTTLKQTVLSHPDFRFKVVSDSMHPVLEIGTLVKIEKVEDLGHLKRFDMIVFRNQKALTVHFVWCHNSLGSVPTVTTRSLKNPLTDDIPVDLGSLVGRVIDHRISTRHRLKMNFMSLLRRNR